MIIRKQPLVKLLEQADQLYEKNHQMAGRGRPYVYSEKTIFKCLLVKAVKRLNDCSGLYNYLAHEANAHIPPKLRNLDRLAEWGKSGYRGWTYGYKALALCNCGVSEPAVFVDGWVETANVSETCSVREQLAATGLPSGNRVA